MNELEQLLIEKRRIEDQINLIRGGLLDKKQFGNISYTAKVLNEKQNKYTISILMKQKVRRYETYAEAKSRGHDRCECTMDKVTSRWQSFISEGTEVATIETIERTIANLNCLLKAIKEED